MTESKLLTDNIAVISVSELRGRQDMNLSAEFHVNRLKGKKPYKKGEGGKFKKAKGGEISNSTYLNDEQMIEINHLKRKTKKIEKEIEKVLQVK